MAQRFPLITAHSGCMNTLDNTRLSVETGLRLGADVIEEDVRVTRDGVPVLAHDDKWYTVDGRECFVSQMSYDQLSELTIEVGHQGRGEFMRFCPLEEILPLVRESGKVMNLDLKVDESIEQVAVLVKKYGMTEQTLLSGCQRERALKAQETHPELRKLLNVDANLFVTMTYEEALAQSCQDALTLSCCGLNLHYLLVRPELVDYTASLGLPLYVWTVDEKALMRQFVQMNVCSITTRNVQVLVDLKREHATTHCSFGTQPH